MSLSKACKPLRRPNLSRKSPASTARIFIERAEKVSIQEGDCSGILTRMVVKQHVAAEVRITSEDLVRPLSGQDDLVAGIAYRTAQEVFGDTVSIEAEGLRLQNSIGEVIGEIVLPDRDRKELRSRHCRHLPRLSFLVVFGAVETQCEGADRLRVVSCGKAEDGT